MSNWQKALRIGISIGVSLYIFGIGWLGISSSAVAQSLSTPEIPAAETSEPAATGSSLFSANCAACHAGGGNIIRRGKNLKRKAMVRNGFGEVGAIASLVTKGKGIMPAYADRLTGEEIDAIAQYVHQRSESGW